MKKMLSPNFRKKVHMIREEALDRFLLSGFEQGLPDEFRAGCACVDQLVSDFVAFRMFVEAETRERVPIKKNSQLLYHPRPSSATHERKHHTKTAKDDVYTSKISRLMMAPSS